MSLGKRCNCSSFTNPDCRNCKSTCEEEPPYNQEFNVKHFLNNLLTKGSRLACDESSRSFNNRSLPPYYNEEMFKRGQAFFHKNICGMFLGSLLSLLGGLSLKSSLAILILTNMSNSDLRAYKRYTATILHMMIWYDNDFRPGSRLWESISYIKSQHNLASKKASQVLKYPISQKDMALTQLGFMGLPLTRNKMIGIHLQNEEDLKCFIHVWRVLGYVLGIEEEFNICRESVEETRAICDEIFTCIIKPEYERRDTKCKEMCSYLINGLWPINPSLNLNTFNFYLEAVLDNNLSSISKENINYRNLNVSEKVRLHVLVYVLGLMRFSVIRIILNFVHNCSLWVAERFPFLAYYQFGKQNSHVNIMGVH